MTWSTSLNNDRRVILRRNGVIVSVFKKTVVWWCAKKNFSEVSMKFRAEFNKYTGRI